MNILWVTQQLFAVNPSKKQDPFRALKTWICFYKVIFFVKKRIRKKKAWGFIITTIFSNHHHEKSGDGWFFVVKWLGSFRWRRAVQVHKNWGEIPTFQENKSFSLRIKPSRESIQDILKRKVGNSLGIEDEFQTMLLLTRSKKKNDVLHLPYNMPLEVFYAAKWREATKIMGQNDEETDENPQIKVAWPGSDSLTSVHPLPDVRTLGSEVLCYSRDPFKRASWRQEMRRRAGGEFGYEHGTSNITHRRTNTKPNISKNDGFQYLHL